jgi:hypothetical protein
VLLTVALVVVDLVAKQVSLRVQLVVVAELEFLELVPAVQQTAQVDLAGLQGHQWATLV